MTPTPDDPTWHTLTRDATLQQLHTLPSGLLQDEAAQRVSAWSLLVAQFKNVLTIILLVATALSALLGHEIEAIAVIVLFAVLLGFVQEYRAERAIEALRQMAAPMATVLRDREEVTLRPRPGARGRDPAPGRRQGPG